MNNRAPSMYNSGTEHLKCTTFVTFFGKDHIKGKCPAYVFYLRVKPVFCGTFVISLDLPCKPEMPRPWWKLVFLNYMNILALQNTNPKEI